MTETDHVRVVREALMTLRDCDWMITPNDRMDAVRDIARAALPAIEAIEAELERLRDRRSTPDRVGGRLFPDTQDAADAMWRAVSRP